MRARLESRLVTPGHPARRDGVISLVLFLIPGVIALGLLFLHKQVDAGTVGILVTAAVGMPTAWLAWAVYRSSASSSATQARSLRELADQLAIAVGAQWDAEANTRRLNDPYPLPGFMDPRRSVADRSLGFFGAPRGNGCWLASAASFR
jgi:hypothetical protein